MTTINNKFDELAPCGVFCGACPPFNKTCKGCSTNDKVQDRCSKWKCKIRNCCYNIKKIDYCAYCEQFPCKLIKKKLVDSHPDDLRYTYRHEIPDVFVRLRSMPVKDYLNFQIQRWKCESCGGTVQYYVYKCNNCGKEKMIK